MDSIAQRDPYDERHGYPNNNTHRDCHASANGHPYSASVANTYGDTKPDSYRDSDAFAATCPPSLSRHSDEGAEIGKGVFWLLR